MGLANQFPLLFIWVAGSAAPDGSCNCESTCTQLVAGLRSQILQLQAEVHTLRSGPKARATQRRASALPSGALACGTDWYLESDEDVAAVSGCAWAETVVIGASVTSLGGLWSLETAWSIHLDGTNLVSLSGLQGLLTVQSTLSISSNPRLESLTGLESVAAVEYLDIYSNNNLKSLMGLEALAVTGTVDIDGNPNLISLSGLEHLVQTRHLKLIRNPSLSSLSGLQNLRSAREIEISGNARLPSLNGLEKITSADLLMISENQGLESLTGLDNLQSVRDRLTIEDCNALLSMRGLGSLRTVAGSFRIANNLWLTVLDGLGSLESVQGELSVVEVVFLRTFDLGSLTRVGGLTLQWLAFIESFAGLRNLAIAGWISIKQCGIRSLEGLALHSTSQFLVQEPLERMEYWGGPFARGASVGVVNIDEAAWPSCITPHERAALVSAVGDMAASSIPANITSVPALTSTAAQACKPASLGTFVCVKGQACSFALPGEESVFISGRFTGCGFCLGKESNVTESGILDLGYSLKDEEAGLRSICRCGSGGGPVAQLLLRGARQSGVTVCSRGRNCTFKLDGEALERTDHVVVTSNCSERNPLLSFVASWTAENAYLLSGPAWHAAPPNRYQVCWRAPCTPGANGTACPALADSYFHVGEVDLFGAHSRSYTLSLGDHLSVPNIGFGVADVDRMRLRRTCGVAIEEGIDSLEASSSGGLFNFGRLTEDRVQAGVYHLCWCQERDGMKCNTESHFLAESGDVEIQCPAHHQLVGSSRCSKCAAGRERPQQGLAPCTECPAGQFSLQGESCEACHDGAVAELAGRSACVACVAWQSPDDLARSCSADAAKIALLAAFLFFVAALCATLVRTTRRRISVVDVSPDQDRTIITTFGSHGFSNFGRRSFPVTLCRTGHPGLDSPSEPLRVRVKDAVRLELLTWVGGSINKRLDTSTGTLVVAFPHDLYHQRCLVMPLVILLPTLLTVVVVLAGLVLQFNMITEALLGSGAVFLVSTAASAAVRFWPRSTPLAQRLSEFKLKVLSHNPNPKSCEKGPDRALSVGKLHDLLEFFHDFIRDRTAYFMDTNLIQPLTKAHGLSYAEFVGPGRVEWFVSHFWGTAFAHFCEALQKHAKAACGSRKWTELCYWVCFCSNNQHQIADELGSGWEESSFYVTLKSGDCRGTCMVLDDKALPLTRTWCIFELLQTVKLQRSDENFHGLLFCTSSGVLNAGNGSVEVAMALAKRVAEMDLQKAEASSAKDQQMIHKQVIEEMGSFDGLNHFVSHEVRKMLVRAQSSSNQHFAAVLALVDKTLANTAKTEAHFASV